MRGLIGHPLVHSYSTLIHKLLSEKEYKLYDVNEEKFKEILKNKKLSCLNVTIPYKEKCIEYLDEFSDIVKVTNSVNCIKKINNKLIGHNSDYYGFKYLIEKNDINLKNKNVAILGNGGSCKTIKKVVSDFKAANIYIVSRKKSNTTITYDELYKINNIECIINTTPVGMYPNVNESVIDISRFQNLESVIDIIYNPSNTKLLIQAKMNNIKAISGLDMLVAQAFYAVEFFDDISLDKSIISQIISKIKKDKQNIVLIGMPASGKSTIANLISEKYNYEILDMDKLFEEKYKISISNFFQKYGENKFRDLESKLIEEIQNKTHCVISTGGGVIKNVNNIINLKKNGIIIMLDRSLEKLEVSKDRPLSSNYKSLEKLYNQRIHLYRKYSDFIVDNNTSIEECLIKIKEIIL